MLLHAMLDLPCKLTHISYSKFSSVQHQVFQHDSKRKKKKNTHVEKPPDVFLMQLQGTTHTCSSKQQDAEKQ